MTQTSTFLTDIKRYTDLIAQILPAQISFAPSAESATDVQVERGAVYAKALAAPGTTDIGDFVDRLIELSSSDRLARLAIVDRDGHHRPVYRGLLVYAWLQAFRLLYETLPRAQFGRWEDGVRPWCDLLESELTQIDLPSDSLTAGRGSSATEAAWDALALYSAGKVYVRDAWLDLASDTFGRIVRGQTEGGAFLRTTPADNPDTHTYHELLLLHAAASYAVQAEDRVVATAVAHSGEYHLRETQPDHATTQPWAVFAFVWNESTHSLADQLLHAVQTSRPGELDGISAILLADALHCLKLFV